MGTANDGREFDELTMQSRPGLIMVEIPLPVMNGFESMTETRIQAPAAMVICLAMQAGARVETSPKGCGQWR